MSKTESLLKFVLASGNEGRSFKEIAMCYNGKTLETYIPYDSKGSTTHMLHHFQEMRVRQYSKKCEYIYKNGNGKWVHNLA